MHIHPSPNAFLIAMLVQHVRMRSTDGPRSNPATSPAHKEVELVESRTFSQVSKNFHEIISHLSFS